MSDGKPLYGFHRFESDTGEVRFDSDLELNGALVYVKGDVTLTKPLKGTGALVASGKMTILGGADIKADFREPFLGVSSVSSRPKFAMAASLIRYISPICAVFVSCPHKFGTRIS